MNALSMYSPLHGLTWYYYEDNMGIEILDQQHLFSKRDVDRVRNQPSKTKSLCRQVWMHSHNVDEWVIPGGVGGPYKPCQECHKRLRNS